MKNSRLLKVAAFIFGIIVICVNISTYVYQNKEHYLFSSYKDREKAYEKMFDFSQYKKKNPTYIITDNIVYAHAAYRYISGGNPTHINPEVPPLGKYVIGLSIIFFQNENILNLFFSITSIVFLYILSLQILKERVIALIPSVFLSFEPLFKNQILISPQLDIMQFVFLLVSFIFINIGLKKKASFLYFFTSAIFVGFFISTKFFATGFLVLLTFFLSIAALYRKKLFPLVLSFLITPIILLISYSKLFFEGYSFWRILGVQKWVYLYNSGHLDFPPFVVFDLILLNKWHTWWGERGIIQDSQWVSMWPVIFVISVVTIIFTYKKNIREKSLIVPVYIWVTTYFSFLCVGQVTSRYFLLFIPFLYIVSTFGIVIFYKKILKK